MYVYRQGEPAVQQPEHDESELQRGKPRKPFDLGLCGTQKGYQQHRRHGLEQCADCRRAHTEYEKARTRRKE